MFCRNCGHKIREGKKFCTSCGTPVGGHAPAQRYEAESNKLQNIYRSLVAWCRCHKKALIIGGIILVGLIAVIVAFGGSSDSLAIRGSPQQSVVDILCDNGNGGSGTIFTPNGTVLTNNHVIKGAKTCQVTIPNPATGGIAKIYDAAPVIVPTLSKEYDVAMLKIDGAYMDSSGKTWGPYPTTFTPFTLPSTCDPNSPSQLGDSVRIYGYPVTSGGFNLTITDGVISSFADNGDLLTSAKVDSGNSGGLAIDQNGCWLGIPSAVLSGTYQNLGVIIPGSIVLAFLNNVPAKLDPVTASTSTNSISKSALVPQETPDQQCQGVYGAYSKASGQTDSNGNPTCGCLIGYSWSTTGDSCVSRASLQQMCEVRYGVGSYSYVRSGASTCGCASGYVWNSDQTECVVAQSTNEQICRKSFGVNSQWSGQVGANGNPECGCQTDYSWSADGNSCAAQTSLDASCQASYGVGSYSFPQNGKAACGCSTSYTWNSSQTACVSHNTDDSQCKAYFGTGSYNTDQTNAQGVPICGCKQGYGWNTNHDGCVDSSHFSQVCFQQYGYSAEATGGTDSNSDVICQCVSGYSVSNGQCVKN